jgi:hypothetical protein
MATICWYCRYANPARNNPTTIATTFTTFFKAYPISIPTKNPPPIVAPIEVRFSFMFLNIETMHIKTLLEIATLASIDFRIWKSICIVKFKREDVLSRAELKFLDDLKKGNIRNYDDSYVRTLKHRILKKHRRLTYEALLINEVLDELHAI